MTDKEANCLIIDCQLLQTSDRNRGMGFYFYNLLSNLATKNEYFNTKWIFLVNKRLPAIEQQYMELLDNFDGSVVQVELLHRGDHELFVDAAKVNRNNIDRALSPILAKTGHLQTYFLIPALFSREIYPVFPTHGTINIMLFYDIIPFLYQQHYFQDHEGLSRKDYSQRFREFYKTDLFLTISQTTADDLNVYFGVDPSRVVTIFGAGANRNERQPKPPKIVEPFKDDFVLMPSGDDYRKNNNLAVQAFSLLKGDTKLVITSNFSPESKRLLTKACPKAIFPGIVTDEEYLWLIDNARAVFFPTEYEGLGMPVLEAVERGTTVVCSNIPVFAEISQEAFFFCDPSSISSMQEALEEALEATEAKLTKKKQHYTSILHRFSWPKTADLFQQAISVSKPAKPKKKLAIFCPSPSSYSAVGKYAFEVHAELSRIYDIDYYVEYGQTNHPITRPDILEYAANCYPASTFDLTKSKYYDHILYNIGNSEFHTETILNALRLPANAIIHDTKLNGIFDYMVNRGIMAPERREYELLIDKTLKAKNTACLASIVTNQKAVFCHSHFAKEAINDIVVSQSTNVNQIIHPIGVPTVQLAGSEVLTISFAGIISEDKGIGLVAEVSKLDNVKINVFGYGVLGDSPLLQGLGANVRVMKNLTDKEFQDTLRKSNILLNYRINYQGETSRSTLEAMRYGAVVIVRKIGWFDELPDDVVVKVSSEQEVIKAVSMLVQNPKVRQDISTAARSYLINNHSYAHYAQLIEKEMQ